jgi:hypothetical protein
MGYQELEKHRGRGHAERREYISASECLECGHLITDHLRAGMGGQGRRSRIEHSRGDRDHCIGNRDTCACRKFVQPHTFTRKSIQMGGPR